MNADTGADPPAERPEVVIASAEELRSLADTLQRIGSAAAAAEWGDDRALVTVVAQARAELTATPGGVYADIGSTGASPQWLARADDYSRSLRTTAALTPTSPRQADADAVVAVALARSAVAEAVLAVAQARQLNSRTADRLRFSRTAALLPAMSHRIAAEMRHIVVDKPRSILMRLVITLGIALSLVAMYHFTGWSRYDAGRLTLYLFSAVIGSVVCTNALCFEADRVRTRLADGDRLWRILVAKNLAMAALVTVTALPIVGLLAVTDRASPVLMIDQLVTMVFIWLGVGNVLSVVWPLRHEPVSARLHDGTWKPYLLSFAVSYGVGLTVNLMIYWRLWSREKASDELFGGDWAAFGLVLLSALTSWFLLTVFAVACSREPRIRGVLSREMVGYTKRDTSG